MRNHFPESNGGNGYAGFRCHIESHYVLVRGIWGCEVKAKEKELTLVAPPFRNALMQAGGAVLSAEIRRAIVIAGKGGERIETAAVLKWINRQRLGAKYKLPI